MYIVHNLAENDFLVFVWTGEGHLYFLISQSGVYNQPTMQIFICAVWKGGMNWKAMRTLQPTGLTGHVYMFMSQPVSEHWFLYMGTTLSLDFLLPFCSNIFRGLSLPNLMSNNLDGTHSFSSPVERIANLLPSAVHFLSPIRRLLHIYVLI